MGQVLGAGREEAVPPSPGVVGLHNFKNTCYMNATVQCLLHAPLLLEALLAWEINHHVSVREEALKQGHGQGDNDNDNNDENGDEKKKEETTKEGGAKTVAQKKARGLFAELSLIAGLLWSGQEEAIVPQGLKQAIDAVDNRYLGVRTQHDAFEFLLDVLLAQVHNAIRTPPRLRRHQSRADAIAIYSGTGAGELESVDWSEKRELLVSSYALVERDIRLLQPLFVRLAANAWAYRLGRKGESLITQHFMGQFKRTATCSLCHHTTISFPSFEFVQAPLSVAEPRTPLDLTELLGRLKEFTDGMALCGNCSDAAGAPKKRECRIRTQLWRVPDVLMVRIARVHRQQGKRDNKLNHPVRYPTKGLELDPFVCPGSPLWVQRAQKEVPALTFDMFAALHHQGTAAHKGHYVAEALNLVDRNTYLFDDATVRRVRRPFGKTVTDADAYILFYQRRALDHDWDRLHALISELTCADRYGKIAAKRSDRQCKLPI